ncbi:MAG: FAD-dependent oxidoreductase [Corallococcus sp.]|nr:FAD-dependent oxidoreductase [Corallococcus sp.]
MIDFLQLEGARCLSCANPACKKACPVSNDIPAFLKFAGAGLFKQAADAIGHPFGEICGYVCPCEQQCQSGCVLSKQGREINIGQAEKELFGKYPYEVKRRGNALEGRKIAVVGGGVCGLTFAVKAYEEDADVTVFERGELLSTLKTIPDFRLPYDAVKRAENAVKDKIDVVKKDVSSYDVLQFEKEYYAVLIATGACVNYDLGIDGAEYATDYKDCLQGNYKRGKVAVVGGGNSAMDCARLAKRNGDDVILAYRRTKDDMPAFRKEIDSTVAENVEFKFNVAPVRLVKSQNGLTLVLAKTVSQGRGRLEITDDVFEVQCDSVIAATGSKFDAGILSGEIRNVGSYRLSDNLYIGGDAYKGKLVADAVADGKKIAEMLITDARKLCL